MSISSGHVWCQTTARNSCVSFAMCGLRRWWALILVFLVSAIGHEVVVGVPLHMLRGWAFIGIMMQVSETRRTGSRRAHMSLHSSPGLPREPLERGGCICCSWAWLSMLSTAASAHGGSCHAYNATLTRLLTRAAWLQVAAAGSREAAAQQAPWQGVGSCVPAAMATAAPVLMPRRC
jgi:hypothetical protein